MRVTVVGAGISGLTSALALLGAGHAVRVLAAAPSLDTTSALAAAVWFPTHVGPPDQVLRWGAATLRVLAAQAAAGVPGVRVCESLALYREPPGSPDWAAAVGGVRAARPDELPPGYRHGLRFAVPLAEMPAYLPWLVERVAAGGGRFELRRLESLADLAGEAGVDAVVNCSGLAARELVPDPAVHPVRGRILRVANPGLTMSVRDERHPGGRAYVHPRARDCVLGGTLEAGEWDTSVDPRRRCGDPRPLHGAGPGAARRRGAGAGGRPAARPSHRPVGGRPADPAPDPQLRARRCRDHAELGLRGGGRGAGRASPLSPGRRCRGARRRHPAAWQTAGVTPLTRGENRPLPAGHVTVAVTCAAPVDVSALLLDGSGRVRDDGDFVFFNHPVGPGVSHHHGQGRGDVIRIDTGALPAGISTVAVTASLDGAGPATFAAAGPLVTTVGPFTFEPTGLTTESAVVCVEVYRRGDQWKVRAVGQGYDDGLAGVARAFGVHVDEPGPPPNPPAEPPAGLPAEPSAGPPPGPPAGAPPPAPAPVPPPHPPPPHPQAPPRGAPPMQSDLFSPVHAEVTGTGIQQQGSKMARVAMTGGEVLARAGSMVAYQGELRFEALGAGGIGNLIRQKLTGEGVPLMRVTGRGDLFLANAASDVHLVDLDGSDGLTINGANVLAFEPTLSYRIARVSGAAGYASNAGLFNCVFTGRGRIAITTDGVPVVLNVDQPTYADPQAAVAWSSSLRTGLTSNDTFNLGTLMGRSTGERYTLSFAGSGFVIVQPSELPPGGFVGGTGGGEQAGTGGGMLGGLLGR